MISFKKMVRKFSSLQPFELNEHPYAPVNLLLGNDRPKNFWKQYYRNEYVHTFKKAILDAPVMGRPVIINVGCKDAREMREIWCPIDAEIHAFEGNPAHQKALRELRNNFRNFTYHIMAVTPNPQDTVTFYVSEQFDGIGGLAQNHESCKPITVEAVTLSDYFKRNDINHVDHMLIDAEGADLDILISFPFDKLTLKTFTIEYHDQSLIEIFNFVQSLSLPYKVMVFRHLDKDGPSAAGQPVHNKIVDRFDFDVVDSTLLQDKEVGWGNAVFYLC